MPVFFDFLGGIDMNIDRNERVAQHRLQIIGSACHRQVSFLDHENIQVALDRRSTFCVRAKKDHPLWLDARDNSADQRFDFVRC